MQHLWRVYWLCFVFSIPKQSFAISQQAPYLCILFLLVDFATLFPAVNVAKSNLSVLTFTQKTIHDMSSWSEDTEEEREKLTEYVSHTPYFRRKYKKGSTLCWRCDESAYVKVRCFMSVVCRELGQEIIFFSISHQKFLFVWLKKKEKKT